MEAAVLMIATGSSNCRTTHGPRAAFRRSWQLTRGAWRSIGLTLLLAYGLAGLLSALPEVGVALVTRGGDGELEGLAQFLVGLGGGLLDLLLLPLPLAVLALLYLDRRARVEGFDLELAARVKTRSEVTVLAAEAVARRAAGDLPGALAAYDQALLLNPDDVVLVCERLGARMQAGNLDGALADAERALVLAPNDPIALHNRGLVRHLRAELAFAHADYDLALVVRPNYADEIWTYANKQYDRGDVHLARAELEQLTRLVPQHAPAHYLLACVAMREQRQDEAAQLLGVAIALDEAMLEHARADELLAPLLARATR